MLVTRFAGPSTLAPAQTLLKPQQQPVVSFAGKPAQLPEGLPDGSTELGTHKGFKYYATRAGLILAVPVVATAAWLVTTLGPDASPQEGRADDKGSSLLNPSPGTSSGTGTPSTKATASATGKPKPSASATSTAAPGGDGTTTAPPKPPTTSAPPATTAPTTNPADVFKKPLTTDNLLAAMKLTVKDNFVEVNSAKLQELMNDPRCQDSWKEPLGKLDWLLRYLQSDAEIPGHTNGYFYFTKAQLNKIGPLTAEGVDQYIIDHTDGKTNWKKLLDEGRVTWHAN